MIIVESPSKCKLIEKYTGMKCIASYGHIRTLDSIIDNKPIYSNITSSINQLKKNLKNVKKDDIILATDNDREGEAIAWHICDVFKLNVSTTKRILFNEITESAIQYSLLHPTIINIHLVHSQKMRQMLDYKIGFTISPYVWNFTGNKQTSAGRCQTPALRILYEHELKEPESLPYKTIGYFTKHNLPFTIHIDDPTEFLKKSIDYDQYHYSFTLSQSIKPPPLSLTTSSLQKLASNRLHYSPKKTMQIAQELYESGHITYIRTDSHYYSNTFIQLLSSYIQHKYDIQPTIRPYLITNNHAHESIHPTNMNITNLPTNQELYHLIHEITVQSVMDDSIYDTIDCNITAPISSYHYHCETIHKHGWNIKEKPNPIYTYLLSIQSISKPIKIKSTQQIPIHPHLSESNLIEKLEGYGIGRPSTYANIIETLKDRGYAKLVNIKGNDYDIIEHTLIDSIISTNTLKKTLGEEKNKLKIQQLGKIAIHYLITNFVDLFNYKYTSLLEEQLDKIALGESIDIIDQLILPEPTIYKQVEIPLKNYGMFEKNEIWLYKNDYGYYIKWGSKNISLRYLATKNIDEIHLDYIIKKLKDVTLIRSISEDIHIRNGKFGVYIQTPKKNYNLKQFKEDYLTCEPSAIIDFITSHQ